jgi:four helix bundle protein
MFRFEKFDVWQRSVELAGSIYAITRSFPQDERFGLTSQMRRASVSVSSNVAEGSSRSSDKDFARFVEVAYGSLVEVVSQASIALEQSLLTKPPFDNVYAEAELIARKLSGLRNTLLGDSGPQL